VDQPHGIDVLVVGEAPVVGLRVQGGAGAGVVAPAVGYR